MVHSQCLIRSLEYTFFIVTLFSKKKKRIVKYWWYAKKLSKNLICEGKKSFYANIKLSKKNRNYIFNLGTTHMLSSAVVILISHCHTQLQTKTHRSRESVCVYSHKRAQRHCLRVYTWHKHTKRMPSTNTIAMRQRNVCALALCTSVLVCVCACIVFAWVFFVSLYT